MLMGREERRGQCLALPVAAAANETYGKARGEVSLHLSLSLAVALALFLSFASSIPPSLPLSLPPSRSPFSLPPLALSPPPTVLFLYFHVFVSFSHSPALSSFLSLRECPSPLACDQREYACARPVCALKVRADA